jgi:uncharacterized membrane protein
MLKLTFMLKETNDDTLALKLYWGFRIVFAVLAAVILASHLATVSAEGGAFISIVMIAAFTLIALYNESWYFDRHNGIVQHLHGLLMLSATSTFATEEIEGVEVQAFRKGSVSGTQNEKRRFFQRDLLTLSLVFTSGDKKDIEITEAKNKAALQRKAAAISDFMEISYHSEV